MLVGKELLDKARALSNRPEDEIAKGCGYVGPSGRVLRKSFYKALVEAKGDLDKAFDIMYHEHLLYYRVENLNFLLNLHGMEVFDVHHADVHGGSIVVYCAHKGERKIEDTVYTMINEEREKGFHKADIYVDFNSQIQDLRKKLLTLINDLKGKDSKIFAYGAPAKGTVMLNYCGLDHNTIDCAVEVNELKVGRYIPKTGIPIVKESSVNEPDYYLLLAWNFYKEFCNSNEFKSGARKFIVPLPEPEILDAKNE